MDCQSLVLALQDLSLSIQELAADPSSFVLHRTQCVSLAKSYALAVQQVTQQLHRILSTCSNSDACHHLLPSFLELQHAMQQGHKLLQDCLYQDGWVKKAVLLALSTEVQDVCLHDLVWCLCVIQQALGQFVLQDDEPESSMCGSLNAVWAETSQNEDWIVLLEVLQQDIALWESQLSEDNSSKEQCSLAKFLLQRLSRECDLDNIEAPWDALPWADAHEFFIKDVIGHGAYSVVYEIQWHGEIYGQKEFFGVDQDVFAREAAIQARLRHPNLLQLICCTAKPSKNRCSLVMELMDTDLRNMIDNRLNDGFNPPFALLTCVDLMLQIAKGMEYLHSLHIMHRDLKALNLLVRNMSSIVDGDSSACQMRLKIADFGMSKAKNESSKYTTLRAGTTYWRAPEVFDVYLESEFLDKSNAKYTKKADVYSFAMVCYEILSGNIPFDDGGKHADLHQRLLKGERPKLPISCPPYLVSYIERCWHGDPEQRPTFGQISRTLRHLKGMLLTTTDPRIPLALSTQSCAQIEDKLEQMMGSQWPSTVAACFSTRSMTISFEMSWYKVMECKLTKQKAAQSGESQKPISLPEKKAWRLKHQNSKLRRYGMGFCCWRGPRGKCSAEKLFSIQARPCQPVSPGSSSSWSSPSPTWEPLCLAAVPTSRLRSRTQLVVFPYSKLAQATNHFSESALVATRGAGEVYKGTLPDGQAVAVKVLFARRSTAGSEFWNELDIVSRVSHRNLVRLLGYCTDKDSLMLVYEFMARGDLGQYLYGQRQLMVLTWAQRYKIACGVASALDYLHNKTFPRILHRDVKPSNIFLDDGYNAHLSDFGIALCQGEDGSLADVRGTPGYVAPEYLYTLELGPEIDVYGFGVVLLQLVSGRRLLEDDRITVIQFVWGLYKQGRLLDAVDERMRGDVDDDGEDQMSRMLLLGLMCCQSKGKDRPTMHEVVQILSGQAKALALAHDTEIFYCWHSKHEALQT